MAKHSLLVVDDDPVILKLVCAFLTRSLADVQVETTSSPNAALQRATAHQYSAVLTDVMMPGMSGMELATKIHAARPDLPIIFMSGMAQAAGILPSPRLCLLAEAPLLPNGFD